MSLNAKDNRLKYVKSQQSSDISLIFFKYNFLSRILLFVLLTYLIITKIYKGEIIDLLFYIIGGIIPWSWGIYLSTIGYNIATGEYSQWKYNKISFSVVFWAVTIVHILFEYPLIKLLLRSYSDNVLLIAVLIWIDFILQLGTGLSVILIWKKSCHRNICTQLHIYIYIYYI